jgi:hypothetical protein
MELELRYHAIHLRNCYRGGGLGLVLLDHDAIITLQVGFRFLHR